MKRVFYLLLVPIGLAVLSVGVMGAVTSHGSKGGKSLAGWILHEMRRSEALEERAEELTRVFEAKKSIITDLVSQRLTLHEAAEQFRQADELIEEDPEGLVAPYKAPLTEKGLYRQVILWVQAELKTDPQQAEQVIPRLQQEMAEECAADEVAE